MKRKEFSDQFDVFINAFSTQGLFGEETSRNDFVCDEYEKSVYLTDAENDLIVDYYTGANPYNFSFEEKEIIREALDSLVKTYYCSPIEESEDEQPEGQQYSTGVFNLPQGKKNRVTTLFSIPKELLWIVYEQVSFGECSCDPCIKDRVALVQPCLHDELYRRLHNPFRGPNKNRVLRLNVSDNVVELISDYPIGSYMLRYVKKPKPIILTDLPDELSIEGQTEAPEDNEQACELPEILHPLILKAAVLRAIQTKLVGKTKEGK